jgi:hypothetical protein
MALRFYLTISEGPSPFETKPFLVSDDPRVIRAVGRELVKRLGLSDKQKLLSINRNGLKKSVTENPE